MSGRRKKSRSQAGHQTPLIPHPAADVAPEVKASTLDSEPIDGAPDTATDTNTDASNQAGNADQHSVASAISATFAAAGQLQHDEVHDEPASPAYAAEPPSEVVEPAPSAAEPAHSGAEKQLLQNEPAENQPTQNEAVAITSPVNKTDQPVPVVRTAGAYLQQLREQQDLSLEQAALRLRVSVPQLLALEHNEWGSFPSVRYARALARSYCRGLGEPLSAVEAVLRLMPPAEQQPSMHMQTPITTGALKTRKPPPRWWLAALALLVMAVVMAVWPRRTPTPAASVEPAQQSTTVPHGSSAPAPLGAEASHSTSVPGGTVKVDSKDTGATTTTAVSQPALVASAPSTKVAVGTIPTTSSTHASGGGEKLGWRLEA